MAMRAGFMVTSLILGNRFNLSSDRFNDVMPIVIDQLFSMLLVTRLPISSEQRELAR
jgi:hypothetical protein